MFVKSVSVPGTIIESEESDSAGSPGTNSSPAMGRVGSNSSPAGLTGVFESASEIPSLKEPIPSWLFFVYSLTTGLKHNE